MEENPVFFEISTPADQAPVVHFEMPELNTPLPTEQELSSLENTQSQSQEASTPVSSTGVGYLAKPKNLYVQDAVGQPSESKTKEELTPLQSIPQEDEPAFEMQMVVKDSTDAAEEQPVQTNSPMFMSSVEEPAMQDEADELRRRAAERIAKLRNLSFNINAADPNNEFETVPAYLRRNMELHNSIANVESFYSNYTVKPNEQNGIEISTINTYLEGKKPD